MKFDNVTTVTNEARFIALPLGKTVVKFKCSHFDGRSSDYLRTKAKVSKPYRKLIDADMLNKEDDRKIAVTAFVKHCVSGWEDVTSEGQSVPFTEDNCIDLLCQFPPLFYSLIEEASERDNFTEGDAGN